jgi:hypothetical protein
MVWSQFLQVLDTKWVQAKTIVDGAMGMALCKEKVYECFMYCFALYIGPGRGLERTPQQKKKKIANYMFPSLHTVRCSETSRTIGNILKAQLPKHTPKYIKEGLTAKSLRYGAISAVSMAPKITLFDVCARSGHKTGTNIDSYFDSNNVERTMPAGNVLFGNEGVVKVPMLELLPCRFKPTMEALYKSFSLTWAVEAFGPGGHLEELGRNSLALLIMQYSIIEDDFGPGHAVVVWMKELVTRSKLVDPMSPDDHPINVLEECSRLLRDLHNARNCTMPETFAVMIPASVT